jgi:Regulator of chromosome condensation (RCC1) repeat
VSGVSGAIAVSTNGSVACAVLSSGAVECWGSNGWGQLGSGTAGTVDGNGDQVSSVPSMVPGLTRATAVAVGDEHACALLLDGTIQCWGSNVYGQLGNGSAASTTPVPVSGVTGAVAIATGLAHTCALMADGTVACWGENAYGELGFAPSSSPQSCASDPCANTPVKVPNLQRDSHRGGPREHVRPPFERDSPVLGLERGRRAGGRHAGGLVDSHGRVRVERGVRDRDGRPDRVRARLERRRRVLGRQLRGPAGKCGHGFADVQPVFDHAGDRLRVVTPSGSAA